MYIVGCADMQQALQKTCRTWLTSMPIMAAQLVLATAAESGSLVLDDRFTLSLPLVRKFAYVLPSVHPQSLHLSAAPAASSHCC